MLVDRLQPFLKNIDFERPLLVGFSGGPDSVALLHLLLAYTKKIGLAHIDHGWRSESAQEAKIVQEIAMRHELPFHLLTLNPLELKGNLENACREERLCFFRQLCQEFGYQGVCLGHHADDQAETVLKRIFEGSTLHSLVGLKKKTEINGLKIFRPLLAFTKTDLLAYLDLQKVSYFVDSTNSDPRYMRARMRQQLIPTLSETFGKAVAPALSSISLEAEELRRYLDGKLKPYLAAINQGWLGLHLNLNILSIDPYELKYLIRMLCEREGFSIQRPLIETACALLQQNVANKWVANGQGKLYIDRRHLFIIGNHRDQSVFPKNFALEPGKFCTENLNIVVDQIDEIVQKEKNKGWMEVWAGQMQVILPVAQYKLEILTGDCAYGGKHSISKWWGQHKVPALLRNKVPVIKNIETDQIMHEFLSGKQRYQNRPPPFYRICMRVI